MTCRHFPLYSLTALAATCKFTFKKSRFRQQSPIAERAGVRPNRASKSLSSPRKNPHSGYSSGGGAFELSPPPIFGRSQQCRTQATADRSPIRLPQSRFINIVPLNLSSSVRLFTPNTRY